MTDRPALDNWLDRADRILDMVTHPTMAPHHICWADPYCRTVSDHPSGLCAAHRDEILAADDETG